jgi:hypothetical protein
MLWTFQHGERQTSFEVYQAPDGSGFRLRRQDDSGEDVLESFNTAEQLNLRVQKLETELLSDGWSLAGALRR